jgi:hypothetical protein
MRIPATVLFLVVALGVQGCVATACTEIGGFDGVGVEMPRSLFVRSGEVTFEVCDAEGCATATQRLGRVPERPVGRSALVTFDDLGRAFEPGRVTVSVRLFDSDGTLVAAARRDIDLDRSYPNGRRCDGEGYVSGSLAMSPDDRVRPRPTPTRAGPPR